MDFGIQTAKKGAQAGGGASNAGITKADMEALIAAAKSSGGPVQTIRVELIIKLSIDETYKM